METVIWKYEIVGGKDYQEIEMPLGAVVRAVQVQDGKPCIWVQCKPDAPLSKRIFYVLPTGVKTERTGEYIGTFQLYAGSLVFHVFEEIK